MWCRVSSGQVPITLGLAAPAHLDGVVGDQPMAAHDQIERALALPDAALADDQHAEPEDVHQHAVHDLAHGQRIVEQRRRSCAMAIGVATASQQRHADALRRRQQIRAGLPAAGDEHAGNVVREHRAEHCRRAS